MSETYGATPLLEKKADAPKPSNTWRGVAFAAFALCAVAGTVVALNTAYSPSHLPFEGEGSCDATKCRVESEAVDHHEGVESLIEFEYVSDCSSGGPGCIGEVTGCRKCHTSPGEHPLGYPRCPSCICADNPGTTGCQAPPPTPTPTPTPVPTPAPPVGPGYHLAPAGAAVCDHGITISSKEDCKDASAALTSSMNKVAGREIQNGNGGQCNDGGWGNVPPGCSVQSGGDWAPHYQLKDNQCGTYNAVYQLVCTGNAIQSEI